MSEFLALIIIILLIQYTISYMSTELKRDCRVGQRSFFSFTVWLFSFTIRWGISFVILYIGITQYSQNIWYISFIPLSIVTTPWFFQKLFGTEKTTEAFKFTYTLTTVLILLVIICLLTMI